MSYYLFTHGFNVSILTESDTSYKINTQLWLHSLDKTVYFDTPSFEHHLFVSRNICCLARSTSNQTLKKKDSVSQCISVHSHLAPYSRNSSYILMTNWLAAGLILPLAAVISFQPKEDVNKGTRSERGMVEPPWLRMLKELMHTYGS